MQSLIIFCSVCGKSSVTEDAKDPASGVCSFCGSQTVTLAMDDWSEFSLNQQRDHYRYWVAQARENGTIDEALYTKRVHTARVAGYQATSGVPHTKRIKLRAPSPKTWIMLLQIVGWSSVAVLAALGGVAGYALGGKQFWYLMLGVSAGIFAGLMVASLFSVVAGIARDVLKTAAETERMADRLGKP